MLSYTLPDGFRWIVKSRTDLEFEHVATEKRGRVSHCERAVTPDNKIQGVINWQCARTLREAKLDALWRECRCDKSEFDRRRAEVLKG